MMRKLLLAGLIALTPALAFGQTKLPKVLLAPPTTTTAGTVYYWNGSAWAEFTGNVSGTQCFQESSSGVPSWGACGSGGSGLVVGTTTITSGTNLDIEYNNAGVLGEKGVTGTGNVVEATSPTISGPTFTGSVTATGLITNADLANSTISGISLGSNLATLTISSPLTGTSYNGSSAVSISCSTCLTGHVFPETVSGTTTSGGIPYFSNTTTLSSSGLLAANALVIGGGAGVSPSTTTTGTGVLTALGVNTGSAGAFVVNGGALGTPSSGTLTNATGLPISGITGLGTGVGTILGNNANASGGIVSPTPAAAGDLVYWNGTAWTKFAGNNSGSQVFTESSSGVPSWTTPSGSGTVTSITPGAGLSVAPTSTSLTPITSSGTLYDDASYHTNFLGGLATSNDGTAPNSVIDVAAGNANDSTNVVNIKIGAFTKSTAGAWAAGSGSNGMGNGLTIAASTWYYDCLAYNGGTPDIWFDTSVSCANKPTGISGSLYRRIGYFKTNGSAQIISYTQIGNKFLWATPLTDQNGVTLSTSVVLKAVNVPPGINVEALINGSEAATLANVELVLSSPSNTNGLAIGSLFSQVASQQITGQFQITTNTSSQINTQASATTGTYSLSAFGWIDPTLGSPGGGGTGGSGTVTSVAQSFTGGLISVAGSPVTSSGTLALTVAGTSGGIPYFSSASTWASSAALASTDIVLGGGAGNAPATDANASLTAGALTLGASGTAGSVKLGNATSGTVVLQPVTGALGSVTASLPANTGTIAELNLAQTFSGAQTFGEVIGTVTTQSGTTYTFAATDCGTEVTFSNASAVTATIPQTLPAGCNIAIAQLGAGKVSVNGSAVTPATLHSAHSYTGTSGQWAVIGINIEAAGTPATALLTGDGS